MSRLLQPTLSSVLVAAVLATPTLTLAAASPVRDARDQACKLVSMPFAAHKSPARDTQYVCGGIAYSRSDTTLIRVGAPAGRKTQASSGARAAGGR